MDVLVTGDLSALTEEICKQLCNENRVVLASKTIRQKELVKRAVTFSFSPSDPMFDKLFDSYSFGAAIFLASRGEQRDQQMGIIEDLDRCLRLCSEHKVSQAIYVTSSEAYAGNKIIDETVLPDPVDSRGHLLAAGENLCRYYRAKTELNTVIVHVPYLYGDSVPDSMLSRTIQKAVRKEKIELPGAKNQLCDFIRDIDLVSLFVKLIDEGYELEQGVINVGSGKPITFDQFAGLIQREIPNSEIFVSAVAGCVPPPMNIETARKYYDWVAAYSIFEQIPAIVKQSIDRAAARKSFRQVLTEKVKKNRIVLQIIELVLGFLLMQYLNNLTEASVQFRFVDFRLLYVVIMGSIHGMRMGILAALLACVSCLLSYSSTGLDWKVLVYNIDNWLPFIAYLVAGAVTGYTKEKNTSTLEFEKEQLLSLEERYIFLYELYDQTLKNKSQYKDQLIGYRDSFGRIYAITQRLDSVLPDAVFQEAAAILENVLESQTIAIYTVDQNKAFARLAVSSKILMDKMEHSIRLSEYDVMIKSLKKDEVWCNKDLIAGYPVYCAPVYDQNQLVALIMVKEAHYEQITTNYSNLIKVLCGLIQASLVRATSYNAAVEEKLFIKGTRILTSDRFEEILSIKQKMKEDNLADFKLLRVTNQNTDIHSLSDLIVEGIRTTDTIGQRKDGGIYLILSQAKQSSIDFVVKRLERSGILCSLVEKLDPA